MSTDLIVILILGMVLMCIPIGVQMKWYGIALWKSIPASIAIILTGVYGSQLWFYIENGFFEGRSLYGAVFLAPIVYLPLSMLIRIPYTQCLDFCAPPACMLLAVLKLQCLKEGCCQGMVIGLDENLCYIRFPSQIVEAVAFIAVAMIPYCMSRIPKYRGKIYPWSLVLYGSSRFVLNLFRDISEPYVLGLSAGSFWSLIALAIGVLWLHFSGKSRDLSHANSEQNMNDT